MPHPKPWSRRTKDLWFFGTLALVTLLVVYLLAPFAYVLLFAAVVVVVTWPLYQRVLANVHKPGLAALLSTLILALVVFVPLGLVGWMFVNEAVDVGQQGVEFVQSGKLQQAAQGVLHTSTDHLPGFLRPWVPKGVELADVVGQYAQTGLTRVLSFVTTAVPAIIAGTASAGVDAVIFVFAVLTLFVEGPAFLRVVRDLVPLDDAYETRLFEVFRDLANSLVTGTLATALVQGVVATIGYAIAGVDGLVFFGLLTAVCSLVPFVGAAIVYLPLVLYTWAVDGWGWALFLLAWNLVLTSNCDNIIRPLFMRGRTNVHPLLVFLAVFGGIAWMGLPGALVGPVIVAAFVALYTIYVHDFLGKGDEPEVAEHEPLPDRPAPDDVHTERHPPPGALPSP